MLNQRRPRRIWLLSLALGAFAVLSLSACGGGSSTSPPLAPAVKNAVHHDPVSGGTVAQQPMRGTGGAEINDDNPGAADSGKGTGTAHIDPCTLVSRAHAQAIIGKPIANPQEAPLGPTCIYQALHSQDSVTLAVESVDFARLRSQIRQKAKITVAGHTAYCGVYGRPTTFVLLSGGRVLNVGAPCDIGLRFATEAVARLSAEKL